LPINLSDSTAEIMEAFQDTTLGNELEAEVVDFLCINSGCNKRCKSTDEGINAFMKYCNACNIKLAVDLSNGMGDASFGVRADDEEPERPYHEEPEPPCDEELERPYDKEPECRDNEQLEDEDVNEMSLEDIQNALCCLVRTRDARQSTIIKIGALVFFIISNLINHDLKYFYR
jgi:hypothetical protein